MTGSKKHIARWVSVLSWIVAVSLLLIIGFRFFISTELANRIIQEKVISEFEKELDAKLEITGISGDAWDNLIFEEIQISNASFVGSIEKLELSYVLIDLLFGNPSLEAVILEGVVGALNFDNIAFGKSSEVTDKKEVEPSISINQFQIFNGDFEFKSNSYLPDSTVSINDVVFEGDLEIGSERSVGIKDLRFNIKHGRLPETISFGLDGSISDDSITLNDLIFGIGESVIEGAINANFLSDSLSGFVVSENVDLKDFISSISADSDFSELEMELKLDGSLTDFEILLLVDSPELQNFEFKTGIQWHDEPTIQSLRIYSDYVNSTELLDSIEIIGGPIELDFIGGFTGVNENSEFEWNVGASNLEVNGYLFENFRSEGELINGNSKGKVEFLTASSEDLELSFNIDGLYSGEPIWAMDYYLKNINPRRYNNEFKDGQIHASGKLSGISFTFPESPIDLIITNQNPINGEKLTWIYGEDKIDEVIVSATLSTDLLKSEGFVRISDSNLDIEVQAFNPFDNQSEYTYQANFDNLDIGRFSLFEGNSSSITGGLYGIGSGRSPESASIFGTLSLQSGQINNADIDSFEATVQYDYGILKIKEGLLQSDIVDGVITGQRDLMDVTNPENQLNLSLNIKNLQPLAGIFGLRALEAKGQLDGIVQQDESGELIGNFDLNLTDVLIDSAFTASAILGTSIIQIESKRTFNTNVEILNPLINDLVFQDIRMQTIGYFTEDSLLADFDLTVIGSDRGRLIQEGTIRKDINQELSDIQFTRFDIVSIESNLVLQKPFNVKVFKSDFGTDTLKLSSENGAFLEFAIPFSSESEAQAFVKGDNFDLGLIQEIILGERFIDGILSGELNYHQTPGDVLGNGLARIDEIVYEGAEADSLIFSFDIINERLDTRANIYWENTLAVAAWVNVPFVINKDELDDEFYNRPIRGSLDIQPTSLSKFELILEELGIENTTGIASINSIMSGEAGKPQFTGVIEVDEPELSGIPVDRLSAEFNYSNPTKRLIIQSEIFALNTPVAELNIAYPLDYDFRTFELYLPDENDELEIKAVTNNLNIALFNDFVDPNYMSSMTGELNADIQFVGSLGNIQPTGFLNLRRGSFNAPYLGINLKNIIAEIDVDSTGLNVNRLYAESGQGRLFSEGSATLNGLIPENVSLVLDANLFELAKRRDMNVVVDLDAELTGSANSPLLDGNVAMRQGYYILENFGDEALEDIELEDEFIESFAPFDSLTIDVNVEFSRDFFIRSSDYLDLEFEPFGLLDLRKKRNEEVQLFGVLDVDEGYIWPLGKRFDVENGTIAFSGSYINPALNIRSSYTPQTRQKGESVELFYLIRGAYLNPEFAFESDPQMEQSDVICFALFNKPCYSLESWQTVFAEENNTESFQALSDVLLDEVETLATRELGVDVVQIDNSGQNGRTAITTGWYLNERTFFSIINELTSSTPKTLFVLEYLLNESWDLIITQGEDSRQGVDVRYQFDY